MVIKNPLNVRQRLLQTMLRRVRPARLADAIKQLIGVQRVPVETPHGTFSLDPVSTLGAALTLGGAFEESLYNTFRLYLRPGMTFVDLGANEGYFTVVGAQMCAPGGTVLAIEPQERLLPVIAENLRHNACQEVRVANVAVSDQPGTAVLHLAPSTNNGSSGLDRATRYAVPTQSVETLTLSQLLDREGIIQVDFMKVDIEGFEYEALLGSPGLFREHRIKVMALELHGPRLAARGKAEADITSMLERFGYTKTAPFGPEVWTAPATA